MNAAHEQHAAEAKAKQSAARGRQPKPLALTPGEAKATVAKTQVIAPTPHEDVEVQPDAANARRTVAAALAPAGAKVVSVKPAKATKPAAAKTAAKPKGAKAPIAKMDKVPGQQVRDFMAANDLSGKDLAAIGGFSLSRVAELRNLEMPASWGGRDRHATTKQWGEIVAKANVFIAKRDKAAARKG